MKKEIKDKIWSDIFSWESCDEVKPPTEEGKINFAIEQSSKKTLKEFSEKLKEKIKSINDDTPLTIKGIKEYLRLEIEKIKQEIEK